MSKRPSLSAVHALQAPAVRNILPLNSRGPRVKSAADLLPGPQARECTWCDLVLLLQSIPSSLKRK